MQKIAPKNTTQRQMHPKNMSLIVSKIFILYHKQESNRIISQNSFCERKPINITRNKSKFRILKKNLSLKKTLISKTTDNPVKNLILQQKKAMQTKKYINKRNISGLRKIPTTSINSFYQNKNNNINRTLDNNSRMFIQLNEKNKKLITLKLLKKQILMGPNSTNENQSLNHAVNNINKKHGMNTMLNNYNNYLSHKNTYSEMNSIFIYNKSTSNTNTTNTTSNTHTNSNNKNTIYWNAEDGNLFNCNFN